MDVSHDEPDLEQVRSLLREQYGELSPKGPGWVGRLAERFRPEPKPAEWVELAVSEVVEPVAEPAAPVLAAADPDAQESAGGPEMSLSEPSVAAEPLSVMVARLSALVAELNDLAGAGLSPAPGTA